MTPGQKATVDAVTAKLLPEHEKWLTDFANDHSLSFDELMDGARDWLDNGSYTCIGVDIDYGANDEFWKHYEGYTAEKVPEDKRDNFFRCAC